MEEIYFPNNKKINIINTLGIVVGCLLLLYLLMFIFTKRDKRVDNQDIKKKIDSLNLVNERLVVKQRELDSMTQEYDVKLQEIDERIETIKGRKVIIREYYNNQIDKSKRFTVNQADSFLRDRYNY